jgi:hypothetical protein
VAFISQLNHLGTSSLQGQSNYPYSKIKLEQILI